MLWLCDIRIPAAGSGVQRARALVDRLTLSVDRETREDLRLLISEVTTNAVRHGAPHTADGEPTVRVRIGVADSCVRVEVHDRGPGFEPAPREPGAELDSGWGVHFVQTLAERWGAGRRATGDWIVWFELALARSGDGGGGGGGAMRYGQRADEGQPLPAGPRAGARPAQADLAGTG
ncbi:MAG: ATP-binding protein [Solirubrobacterales bacterium]|nr:ATP-binding protein [Solirubrobacterales bacterium]